MTKRPTRASAAPGAKAATEAKPAPRKPTPPRPVPRTDAKPALRLHSSIARDLGIGIAAGRLRPGDTLAGEIEAAEQLEVSRTAYREAIRILAAKGMVESRTKTGTRVSPRERWHILDPELLGWFLETKPTEGFVRDLFEVRMMVEPYAAALAAAHHGKADLAAMTDALDTMERLGLGSEEGRAADRAFHRQVLMATRNEMIAALSSSVCAAVSWTTHFKARAQKVPRDPIAEHRAVLDAIAAREPERARAEMGELVRLALRDMQAALEGKPARLARKGRA